MKNYNKRPTKKISGIGESTSDLKRDAKGDMADGRLTHLGNGSLNAPPPDYNFTKKKRGDELSSAHGKYNFSLNSIVRIQHIPINQSASRNAKQDVPASLEEPSVVFGGSDEIDVLLEETIKRES